MISNPKHYIDRCGGCSALVVPQQITVAEQVSARYRCESCGAEWTCGWAPRDEHGFLTEATVDPDGTRWVL